MSKHTPGPWKTRKGFDDESIEIYQPNPKIKKPFYPTELATVPADDKEGKANARLIAAAPDLLEALKDYVSNDHYPAEENPCKRQALWAIAKATGEQT